MGILDRIKKGYTNIDKRLGGVLPGGAPRKKETTTIKETTPDRITRTPSGGFKETKGTTRTITPKPSSSSPSSSSRSRRSGGGSRSSTPTPSSSPTPTQSRVQGPKQQVQGPKQETQQQKFTRSFTKQKGETRPPQESRLQETRTDFITTPTRIQRGRERDFRKPTLKERVTVVAPSNIKKQGSQLKEGLVSTGRAIKEKGFIGGLKQRRLEVIEIGKEQERQRIAQGREPTIIKGTVPLVPAIAIPGTTGVLITGAKQTLKPNLVKTTAKFITSKGGKGQIVTKTFFGKTPSGTTLSTTVGAGKETSRVLKILTGTGKQGIVKVSKPFQATVTSAGRNIKSLGGKFADVGIGGVIKSTVQRGAGKINVQTSAGIGLTKNIGNFIVGTSKSVVGRGEVVKTISLFKNVGTTSRVGTTIAGGSKTLPSLAQQQSALLGTQKIVATSVSTGTGVSRVVPTVSTIQTTQQIQSSQTSIQPQQVKVVQPQTTKVFTKITPIPVVIQKPPVTIQAPVQVSRTGSSSRTQQIVKQIQPQIIKQPSAQIITPVQTQPQTIKNIQQFRPIQTQTTSITTPIPPVTTTTTPIIPFTFKFAKTTTQRPKGTFSVDVRRFGKFKTIGTGLTQRQATQIGRQRVATTLGATFRIKGVTQGLTTPSGFRQKKTKKGTLFIEQPKLRLSTVSEITSIQRARRKKKKK